MARDSQAAAGPADSGSNVSVDSRMCDMLLGPRQIRQK